MRKFILRLMLFFIVLLIADRAIGVVMDYFVRHSVGGFGARHNYINDTMSKDILVFGSSRAIEHYNAHMMEDSLGMSCYNCGHSGYGIIFNYGQWLMISKRYHPKYIIYDVKEFFDLFIGKSNVLYLDLLRPYYGREGIKAIFDAVDKTEKYKMLCQMYKSNSRFLQIAADYFYPMRTIDSYGFRPVDKELDVMQAEGSVKEPFVMPEIDSLKIGYLEQMINSLGPTKLIFVISPMWNGMDVRAQQPILDLCEKYYLPLYNFANNPKYVRENQYFYDREHLNLRGANEFTKDLIKVLKNDSIILK
ncbi:hypothetical protein [Bacteroides heparinolyticus]|uniref:hypothetical protein n=2 Tax=Prevotella heparinolytica TaxID=28113 RepID=UPI0035A0339A